MHHYNNDSGGFNFHRELMVGCGGRFHRGLAHCLPPQVEPVFAREFLLHAKHLKQEVSSAQGPHLSQPEESLPPLVVPRVCPTQKATDITCSSAHIEPVAGESLTTQCPGQQGRWTSPPVAIQQQVD